MANEPSAKSFQDILTELERYLDHADEGIEQLKGANDLKRLLVSFQKFKDNYTALDELRKRMYHQYDYLNKGLVPQKLEDAGVDKVAVPELARSYYTLEKTSVSFLDQDAGKEWLRANGGDALIAETVNASALAGFIKDYLIEKGMDPPEDIVKVSTYSQVGSAKYNPKKEKK